ncbi:MAG: replicative DNA helicase [Crocinitomicaceae bacterium]|nr:replicative DNA helicase [Crocinitomicaceae bacterium]|tara:strand:- start:7636 stop:9186 length:1551 start_codon:yes stop_codon:yes gene_type:complete
MEIKSNNSNRKESSISKRNTKIIDSGRIPPQAVDLEKAVLGAMMLEKNAVTDTIDILKENSFYDPKHQLIFASIQDLFGTSKPIDILTVTDHLTKSGKLKQAGGAVYISKLTSRVGSTAHVEYHARIISEKHIKRELIKMSNDVMKHAYDETNDVFDVLNKAEGDLFNIAEDNMGKSVSIMQNVVREAIEEIEKASENSDGISGIPTGFFELDQITSGWQRSDMIVIAARPAMGKTAFVLSMARNTAVDFNKAVAIFSLEMSSVQLVKRLIAAETRIPAEKLRKGDLRDDEFQQLHSRIKKLATAPIYIDDTPAINIFDLRAKCRRLKMQHNIELVIVDYLQLMTGNNYKGGGNREQEISSISRSIKEIAKELNVPIIAISQLSRSVETRGGDKRPQLSDLRESGAIEQDADIVSFIYRPEYYGFMQDEEGNSNTGIGEIIIAKHRNGSLDNVKLRFIKEFAKFDNIASFYPNENESSKLSANNDFDNQSSYTIPSKMNSLEKDNLNFDPNDKPPF